MKHRYFNCCVGWDPDDVPALSAMIDEAEGITRGTFLRHVDRDDLRRVEAELGYEAHPSRGLTMAGDWSVSYHRSRLHGRVVYYLRWSAIEYVFVPRAA